MCFHVVSNCFRQFALFNDRLVYGQPVLPDGADVAWTPVPNETRFAGLTVLSLDDTIVRPSIHRRTFHGTRPR